MKPRAKSIFSLIWKILLLTTSVLLPVFAFPQTGKKNIAYHHFKTFFIDLNNDDKIDTIILSSSLRDKTSFNRISIAISGIKKNVFKAKDQWAEIQPEFLALNKNLVASKYIFIKKTNVHQVIILSGGTDGAGYGGEFSVINIENNNVEMVFDHSSEEKIDSIPVDVEIPVKLADLENNERLCLVYSEYGEFYKSVKGGKIGTYHPFYVFTIDHTCEYNQALSKTYNEQHYVYVEPKHKGEIEIFYPDDKKLKPRLWKVKGK